MSSWAKVGMKVVCINGYWQAGAFYGSETLPIEGEEYTIREFEVIEDTPCCRLVEITNPMMDYEQGVIEAAFDLKRFRPLVSQEDDISMFKSLLKPTEVPA